MPDFGKIPYFDLRHELALGRLPACVGRRQEHERIVRILGRRIQHHVVVTGPSGVGKTRLLFSLGNLPEQLPGAGAVDIAYVDLRSLPASGPLQAAHAGFFMEAFASVHRAVLVLDGFGSLAAQGPQAAAQWQNAVSVLLDRPDVRLVLSASEREWAAISEQCKNLAARVEAVEVKVPGKAELLEIVSHEAASFGRGHRPVLVPGPAVELALAACQRYPSLGQLPEAAVRLLDEAAVTAQLGSGGQPEVGRELLERIVAEKAGVPAAQLGGVDREQLRRLPEKLGERLVGQRHVLSVIAAVLQRARLGLRSEHRPLGSFLLLGPSGVGKTETAKLLAEHFYGRPEAFLRIDMSEFGEAHTVSRLIGAPPGYAGADAGGQLTNHVSREPYSLVLLDEIEKAHPKIFDIFLQALDDGRLTSGGGETVDLTNATFFATSNLCMDEILEASGRGEDVGGADFARRTVLPVLQRSFRTEFLNRFDAILVFKPFTTEELTDIALREVAKIEARTARHGVRFGVTRELLERKVRQLENPRLGARPVKRFVEELCEGLVSEALLGIGGGRG